MVSSSWAHLPHDNIVAVAAPSALDASYPWIAVYGDDDEYLISRSDDAGASWVMIGGDPIGAPIVGATQLSDGTSVLLAESKYWWTTDGGDTWASATLPASVDLVSSTGNTLILAGAGGIWTGSVGGTFTQESTVAIEALGPGPSAVSTSNVYRRSGSSWTDLGSPASNLTSSVHAGIYTFAGTSSGAVYRRNSSTGAWTACGSFPTPTSGGTGHEAVTRLFMDSTTLVAFPAWRGPYRTGTTCSTWTDRSGPPDTSWGGSGGADADWEAWTFAHGTSGNWVVGGWGGLWETPDNGITWYDRQTIPPDYTRDIYFSPNWENDRRLWLAGYSGGPLRSDDGGATFSGVNHGLASKVNVQRYYGPRSADEADTIYVIVNHSPYVSYDAGENWASFASDRGTVTAMTVWDTADEVWIYGGSGVSTPQATTDGGATWTELTALGAEMGSARFVSIDRFTTAAGDTVTCALGQAPAKVVCSWDGGGTWETWATDTSIQETYDLAAWPVDAATRFFYADADGVHYTDDDGTTWTTVDPMSNDTVEQLWVAPSGTVFVATETGWILRSFDGGATWDDPGLRVTAIPQELVGRPDFESYDELLVATHDGTWRVLDADGASPTLERWPDLQIVENSGGYFRCDACVAEVEDPSATHDLIQPLPSGSTASLTLRGDSLRIVGDSDGTGQVEVQVDGVSYGTFGGEVVALGGTLFELSGLAYDWHQISLVGQGSSGVRVDQVVAWGPYDAMEFPVTDADGDGQDGAEWGGLDCDDADPTVYTGAVETWYDGVDQDCDGANDYDQDGDTYDGGLASPDCDDTDPAVHPGAPETWYDGVDQDCDAASDYDFDGDGEESADWGGTDCDDLDPAVGLGAVDFPGDGIDQDCDGVDAGVTVDNDGDGQAPLASGGTDCDDGDPTVYLGAVETWYDGIDQDCDSASDFDQDRDGVDDDAFGGTDCDDTNPTVLPGATETWYDGVDQDCDGNDSDQDLDGYTATSVGGTDCDDTNAAILPGATETWYDGVDQNCDGRNDYDRDGDGYRAGAWGGTDCNDGRANVNPSRPEITGNTTDENCNGSLLN